MKAKKVFSFFLFLYVFLPSSSFSSFDRDPVKDTQTQPVPVTQELLARDSESGPASPTFKMNDTEVFMAKKPYHLLQEEDQEEEWNEEDVTEQTWNQWFLLEETEQPQSSEAIEEKELR